MTEADRPEPGGAFRLAHRAQIDISRILSASAERWGEEGKRRYAGLLTSALRQVAVEPEGRTTRARSELAPGLRSFHVRQTRQPDRRRGVRRPVHLVYYRPVHPGLVEIVRILHERMEPSRHLAGGDPDEA